MRDTSPLAKSSGSLAASRSMKRTFSSFRLRQRSIASTITSGTFSTATSSVSGEAAAVSAVKRPLPQPSSSSSREQAGKPSSQRPHSASGSSTSTAAHFSMRGARLCLFLIRIGFSHSGR